MVDNIDPKHLDRRVAERYLRKGLLAEKDYEQHLQNLPDLTDQAVVIEAAIDMDDFDEQE
jgi:pantothenate kinase